jgi:hypothetical protein
VVVNHYVMSMIQIAGAAMAALGIVYAAQSAFPPCMNSVLRGLVVSLVPIALFGPVVVGDFFQGRPSAAIEELTALLGIVTTLALLTNGEERRSFQQRIRNFRIGVVITLAALVVLILVIPGMTISNRLFGFAFLAVVGGAAVLLYLVIIWVSERAKRMTDRHLQLMGIALALVGLTIQSLPWVFDLLNIPIR